MAKVAFATDQFGAHVGRPAGSDLQSKPASDGGSWTLHPSYSSGSIVVSSGSRARAEYSLASLYSHSGTPISADYFVEAYVYKYDETDKAVAVCARVDTSADTYYMLMAIAVAGPTPDLTVLYKVIAGTATPLGATYVADYPLTTLTRIAIEVAGTSIKGYVGSTEVVSATDSSITDAGKSGVYALGQSANGAGIHLDNWMAYRETTQYETPSLTILTTHAAPTYETFASEQTYETPNLLINTRFSDGSAFPKLPSYTSDPANVYETPALVVNTATPAPDHTIGESSDGDGAHPLFWLNNQDWSSSGTDFFYETPALIIETTNPAPEWTLTGQSPYTTPGLLISLTRVAPEYTSVPVGENVQYETPSLLIEMFMPAPTYSVIEPPVVIPGIITGTAGYAPNTITGTIGTSLRITGVSGRSS